jgi:hypothetical protein
VTARAAASRAAAGEVILIRWLLDHGVPAELPYDGGPPKTRR